MNTRFLSILLLSSMTAVTAANAMDKAANANPAPAAAPAAPAITTWGVVKSYVCNVLPINAIRYHNVRSGLNFISTCGTTGLNAFLAYRLFKKPTLSRGLTLGGVALLTALIADTAVRNNVDSTITAISNTGTRCWDCVKSVGAYVWSKVPFHGNAAQAHPEVAPAAPAAQAPAAQ